MFTVETWEGKQQYETILEAVTYGRIFEIEKDDKGQFLLEDGSGAFGVTLTREQLLALANDLKKLAEE
ncbi:hypothetical protein AAY72_01465 [Alishewanella sp. WH16-1]|uniref:hypothetical protein n=1 Tax=Alishewanella sp. WH16-1 TaxID=1651088 RepID=UPI00071016B3|nr:hypothetical protein [Alishewanella sp. WH16-1]KRS22811.1 hypothetical protein AAY72_01465 [Alishewanella sp. WH16-1]